MMTVEPAERPLTVDEPPLWQSISITKKEWFVCLMCVALPPFGWFLLARGKNYRKRNGGAVPVAVSRKWAAAAISIVALAVLASMSDAQPENPDARAGSANSAELAARIITRWDSACQNARRAYAGYAQTGDGSYLTVGDEQAQSCSELSTTLANEMSANSEDGCANVVQSKPDLVSAERQRWMMVRAYGSASGAEAYSAQITQELLDDAQDWQRRFEAECAS